MNVRLSVNESISLARQFFQKGLRTWARPLVYVLELSQPTLALRWAIQLYCERKQQSDAESRHQQWQWLEGLIMLIDRSDVAEQCDRIAYEAWNRNSEMKLLDRGIARLYWALKNHLQTFTSDYVFQVTSAVGMLADSVDGFEKKDAATHERAIALCQSLLERTGDLSDLRTLR